MPYEELESYIASLDPATPARVVTELSVPKYYADPAAHDASVADLEVDSSIVYACALWWKLTGSEIHRELAIRLLNAWCTGLQSIADDESRLVLAYKGQRFLVGALLLGPLPEDTKAALDVWLNNVFLPTCLKISTRWNNWGAWGLAGIALTERLQYGKVSDNTIFKVHAHMKRASRWFPLFGGGRKLWMENMRTTYGLRYSCFAMEAYLLAIRAMSPAISLDLWQMLYSMLEAYWPYVQDPSRYWWRKLKWMIPSWVFPSGTEFAAPDPSKWPGAVYYIAGRALGRSDWTAYAQGDPWDAINAFRYPKVFQEVW